VVHVVVNEELSRISKSVCFSQDPSCVSFTTFNILAPIYKRIDPQVLFSSFLLLFSSCYVVKHVLKGCVFVVFNNVFCVVFVFEQNQGLRESDFRSCWLARNQRILDSLLSESSSIMCLQVANLVLF
jgi:hypothetical protein